MPAEAHAGAGQGETGAAPVPPTLEAYRDQVDPDHVYSERELLAPSLEQFPPAHAPTIDRKVVRNRRLRARQDATLARMEAALVEAPRLDHLCEGWLVPAVVERRAAATMTPARLLGLIRRRHPRLDAKGRHKLEVQIPASLATMLREIRAAQASVGT
ncbi:phage integrase family domain protein [Burkholderia gladioli]|uniref:Phage integrase family domain protein n=1 Tax=Burkholderia gladioli TaxID=28095 RepID=A0AAW3F9V8_BURGA|nr:phage integrase family domain protein [Burkholderia gladioli]